MHPRLTRPRRYRPVRALRFFKKRATLRRSVALLNDFRFEQSDPHRFYGALARDSVELIGDIYRGVTGSSLRGLTVLDVGGGPGYFERAFADEGAWYIPVEPDPSEIHAAGISGTSTIRGSGMNLPIADSSVDICFSSNVAEHVRDPWRMADEMLRVIKPGGMMLLSYTVWYGPFGGHEMGLTHYLGGERAARIYTERHGRQPKNLYGTSLFKVSAQDGLTWARRADGSGASLEATFPRYHPWWAWWVVHIPGLREVFTSNLVVVLTKC